MKTLILLLVFCISSALAARTKYTGDLRVRPLIVGGQNAVPHSAPYIVSLQIVDLWHICGKYGELYIISYFNSLQIFRWLHTQRELDLNRCSLFV